MNSAPASKPPSTNFPLQRLEKAVKRATAWEDHTTSNMIAGWELWLSGDIFDAPVPHIAPLCDGFAPIPF